METAVVVKGRSYLEHDLGPGTGIEAEWRALLRAVEIARDLGLSNPVFLGDALAVIRQATGSATCRGASIGHFLALKALTGPAAPFPIRYIKRTQNLAGIALAGRHDR